jgi:hypothetical protein
MLATVSGILFFCDSFWNDFTLETLRKLIMTSKDLNSAVIINNEKGISPIEYALLSMMRNRPTAFNNWELGFMSAKYRFSLPLDLMIRHCELLPVEDRCHLNVSRYNRWRLTYPIKHPMTSIRFIDAYKLTVSRPGGIKAAMKRRSKLDVDISASIRALVDGADERLQIIDVNAEKAVEILQAALLGIAGTKKEHVARRNALRRAVRLIDQVGSDAGLASLSISVDLLNNDAFSKEKVRALKQSFKNIVARYEALCKHCPEAMTLDFLDD